MKNLSVIYILLAVVILSTVSCEEDVIPTYSGTSNIYFQSEKTFVGFAFTPDRTDSLINIHLRVMGLPSDSPRPYSVHVSDSSTAKQGVHFDFIQKDFTVAAGALADTLQVKLYKTAPMNTDTVFVSFELVPNEHFKVDYLRYPSFLVNSTNVMGSPRGWNVGWMGTFSEKKLFLMAEVLGFDPLIFIGSLHIAEMRSYSIAMQRWLNQEDAAGRMVYEEDGVTPMEMGPNARGSV